MELHVPCRDPLARLMSGCHFRHHTFDCDTDDLEREIRVHCCHKAVIQYRAAA